MNSITQIFRKNDKTRITDLLILTKIDSRNPLYVEFKNNIEPVV